MSRCPLPFIVGIPTTEVIFHGQVFHVRRLADGDSLKSFDFRTCSRFSKESA